MDEMPKETLRDHVAPCSLFCYSCPGFTRGIICELSSKLHTYFEGFYEFTKKNAPEEYKSRAESFKEFDEYLLRFTQPRCNGCRHNPNPESCIPGCFILECTQEQGVDYCGECRMFPCRKVKDLFDPDVYRRWLRGNERIKEVGITQFYEEEKDKSHYIDFIRDHS
jgi:hypothetical protein